MNQTNQDNNSNNFLNEDTPLLPPHIHSSFLSSSSSSSTQPSQQQSGSSIQLETLADSIRFIIKRDSEISLFKQHRQQPIGSPWQLDAIVGSPMLSSPHILSIPDLEKRRQRQIKNHEHKLQQQKLKLKQEEEAYRQMRMQSSSNENLNNESIHYIENEDDQWERKRKAKLQKVISSSSLASSSKQYSNGYEYSPTKDILDELQKEFAKTKTPPLVAILYGIINTVIVLPVIMSFGSIIYHDDFFRPYLPILIKLTVVSGAVHQLSFSFFSTLPFAVRYFTKCLQNSLNVITLLLFTTLTRSHISFFLFVCLILRVGWTSTRCRSDFSIYHG